MQATIQSLRFEADFTLKEFIQEKVTKLDQFYDNIIAKEITLKKENRDNAQTSTFEIKVRVPNQTLVASESSATFEEATDKCLDQIVRQLKKFKDKQRAVRV